MKRIAYLRVSTAEQRPDRQIDGLKDICDELHVEILSATSKSRPVYNMVIERLRHGDTFLIWDLDRAYRSTKDALCELDRLRERGISIRIANLSIDTETPHGMLIYTLISALAEFERQLLSQRTKEGLAAARRRGKRLGRPPKLTDCELRAAGQRIENGERTTIVAAAYGVSPWTLTRSLKRRASQRKVISIN